MNTLSIVIPAYNERATLLSILCKVLMVDLSPEGLRRAVGCHGRRGFCDACFTGDYPVAVPRTTQKRQLRLIEV